MHTVNSDEELNGLALCMAVFFVLLFFGQRLACVSNRAAVYSVSARCQGAGAVELCDAQASAGRGCMGCRGGREGPCLVWGRFGAVSKTQRNPLRHPLRKPVGYLNACLFLVVNKAIQSTA